MKIELKKFKGQFVQDIWKRNENPFFIYFERDSLSAGLFPSCLHGQDWAR